MTIRRYSIHGDTSSIWMPVCWSCKQRCEPGSSYVAVLDDRTFKWGCEHRPVLDAVVYLGSRGCFLDWLAAQPDSVELERRFVQFLSHRRGVTNCQLH